MRRLGIAFMAASFASGVLGTLPATAAGAEAELREALNQQQQVIQQLQSELASMRQDQKKSEDRVRALEDELANGAAGVDADYVDTRIEQFDTVDESRLFLSGYGTAQFVDSEDSPSTFQVQFNPIFHFRLTDRLHFNSELEIGLESGGEGHDAGTTTELDMEFATIDYLATDWLTLTAGQFLLPFNEFGPRLHPGWINKLASMPPIYTAHGHGGGMGIIPVLKDVGIMASGGLELWNEDSKLNYAVYLTNGWGRILEDEDMEMPGEEHEGDGFIYGTTPDINNNKAVGGRIGLLPIPNLELGASWQTGLTNGPGDRYHLLGFDAWYWLKGLELRGEYIQRSWDSGEGRRYEWGYYLQGAYRLSHLPTDGKIAGGFLGRLEPVLRWGQILEAEENNRKQVALGLNYWLYESVPLKFTYEFNSGAVTDDRLFVQVSYGF